MVNLEEVWKRTSKEPCDMYYVDRSTGGTQCNVFYYTRWGKANTGYWWDLTCPSWLPRRPDCYLSNHAKNINFEHLSRQHAPDGNWSGGWRPTSSGLYQSDTYATNQRARRLLQPMIYTLICARWYGSRSDSSGPNRRISPGGIPDTNTHTQKHTYIHAHTKHTHTHARTHKITYAHTQTLTHTHSQLHTHPLFSKNEFI